MSVPARLLSAPIHAYQWLRRGRSSPCRFVPSCSTYALEALARFGGARGSWLALRRIGHCHPWGAMGSDPVPERVS